MKTFFKTFIKGGAYYGVALYILLSFLFNVSREWWIFSTCLFAGIVCFIDYFATMEIRSARFDESMQRKAFNLERDSHNGTQKRCMELTNKLKKVDHNGYIRGLNKAQEIADKVFKDKETK